MERGISIVRFPKLTICALLIASLHSSAAHAADALVLVASKSSPITELTSLEIRKIYLGFTVQHRNGESVRAITNESDSKLSEIFLQNVMAMSRRTYNRRLLTLTIQSGRPRPVVETDLDALRRALVLNSMAVTCVWESEVGQMDNAKVIKVLWQP